MTFFAPHESGKRSARLGVNYFFPSGEAIVAEHAKRLAFIADWGSGEIGISRQQADQLLRAGATDEAGLRPDS